MLIRFRVKNFRSIRDEQELSLVASGLTEHAESLITAEHYDFELLRSAAVYGANASGKSTVINALSLMRSAVLDSHRSWSPEGGVKRTPFALDPVSENEPSEFVVDLLVDGIRYEYGFSVDSERVLEEWLHAWPKGRRQEWFSRQKDEFTFSRLMAGENRAISALTRPNSLYLSAAAQNNHELLTPIHKWFSSALSIVDDEARRSLVMRVSARCRDPEFRARVYEILRAADIGITDIRFDGDDSQDYMEQLIKLAAVLTPNDAFVKFQHGSGSAAVGLPFEQESAGTRAIFGLAGAIVDVIAAGGTLVVDELDRSLHPHLALEILRIFNDPATNPNNAQLIFNTHDTNLLDPELLRRDQVWFTEKGEDGATRLFPLTDFRARKYENLQRGYLQGRYGAVPAIGTPKLRRVAGE